MRFMMLVKGDKEIEAGTMNAENRAHRRNGEVTCLTT